MDIPDVPDIPEPPDAPLPPVAALSPDADLAPLPGGPIGGVPGGVIGGIPGGVVAPPALPGPVGQGARATAIAPLAPEAPVIVSIGGQDEKSRQPTIPETELLSLLVDIVKRDSDPNVRNEALQGIYRLRTDASINALIQLYDGTADAKIKGEIIPYLLRREGREGKVDNSKAIAKLVAIAKSEQNEELRNKAVRYLGAVRGDEGADVLIQIYDGLQDQKMKQYVIRSLAQNRSRKAVDKLIQIAKSDSDPAVRQYAVRSLYRVDSRHYLEFIDNNRKRIGRVDGQFFTPTPFVFEYKPFEFDTKKWEEWRNDWQKNWEEQSEKWREMIERMGLDGKLKIEDIQNRLRIDLPKIEIQLKDLGDKVRFGYGFDCVSLAEGQLRSQLAAVEAQIAAMRAQRADTDPMSSEMRNLRNALQRQLNSIRSMRTPTPRPTPAPGKSVTSSAVSIATPKAKAASPITVISF